MVAGEVEGLGDPPGDAAGTGDVAGEADAGEETAGDAPGAVDAEAAGLGSWPGRIVKLGVVPQAATITATRISRAIRISAFALGQRSSGTGPE